MLDNALPAADPTDTTTDLSHLAFCVLVALALERQSCGVSPPYAETLFLIRWLATAQRQRRFPKSVAIDIRWLLERGRRHGAAAKLRQHLEYLWHSCSGNIAEQSDLFRLTYATETLKQLGWDNAVMSSREWHEGVLPETGATNGFYVEKAALNAAYDNNGRHNMPVEVRVVGDRAAFINVMQRHQITAQPTASLPNGHQLMLLPGAHCGSAPR
ncbi:Protein of uncharacterised function (DUF2913) [Klebsiella pneumoniae]|uniref:Protein of uncharacterized function (DUF2913) n=2 Tax=Klebsiella pneumoniae TaxID=573 RepID=A0A377YXI6_KLEPO|nr:DUF2913 family protein [Klebsiella pneumoniae]STU54690.1 Protein of uncharacterised function (DUF2913) [Klebsiella pneumoniae subsp. ozaenae]VFS17920.1 Protein of uncharacterised function (DUF2913) [Serratia liquefaciens]KHF62085.1 hypothetical protein LV59_05254 [Klebsiella pneumoniae]MDP8008777.1 DUF2913 family protein [Klebsiella pneumoniae subsp. pneumoniae]MDP8022632.1 DUF2913 family protein [Klebsiella pneumoniae subsp. pneumoniae]